MFLDAVLYLCHKTKAFALKKMTRVYSITGDDHMQRKNENATIQSQLCLKAELINRSLWCILLVFPF